MYNNKNGSVCAEVCNETSMQMLGSKSRIMNIYLVPPPEAYVVDVFFFEMLHQIKKWPNFWVFFSVGETVEQNLLHLYLVLNLLLSPSLH